MDSLPIVSRLEAKARGLKRYFTGKPCKHGHVAERFVCSWSCVACVCVWQADNPDKVRERKAAWNANNQERASIKKAAWRAANPEKARAIQARWYSANREKARAAYAERYARNHEKELARCAAYRAANPEKVRAAAAASKAANPEGARTRVRNRRALERAADGYHKTSDVERILAQQKYRCANPTCRKSVRHKRHVDHIVPLSKGGSNWPRNLQILCPTCNIRKNNKCPIKFAREQGMLL